MNDDNAAVRVIQDLRALTAAQPPGSRLPTVRELSARHQASPVTVTRAIRALTAEGVLDAQPGRGTFVARRPRATQAQDLGWQSIALGARPPGEDAMQALLAVPRPGMIPLSSGYLDADLQPAAALGAALARAARQPAAWQRGPVEGREDLRAWFARTAGGELRAEDMNICPGGQSALSTAFRALCAPGDPVLVEAPTYLGALAAARAAGLRVVPVPADAEGVRPDLLEAAFRRTGARLFYCQPLYANPHGATLAAARRPEVMAAVRKAGAFLLEDDYARDLAIDGDPPRPLVADDPHGHVVYLRSLTKSAAPGLRVAAIGARGAAGARLRAARVLDDFFVAGPLQQAALDLVTSPAWPRHLKSLRAELRARREALTEALAVHVPTLRTPHIPAGGLHVWARLPHGMDDVAVTNEAAARQVVVFPGRPWFAAEPDGAYLRLTFAAAPPDQLREGVRRLKGAAG
ncbi:PLP-dependent aminotransferase family protein [Dactylosporangium sp. NPDC000521]|uniref:aminotransferase-like domain-containing protein n=1 Tax=Dactylosporangium sp. NPDC000521 TaxID=3363975 RepID=UPI00367BEAF2